MKKKILAILLCTAMFIIPAYAAMGAVRGYAQLNSGNVMLPYMQGYDWVTATTYTEEYVAAASKVQNIFARADVVDFDTNDTYKSTGNTAHYVLNTSATTDQVIRNWNLPTLTVISKGVSRARYIDDSVHHVSFSGTKGKIGGENLKSSSNLNSDGTISSEIALIPLGFGKSNRLTAVAQDAFMVDLSGYQYISDGELCDLGSNGFDKLHGQERALAHLLFDIYCSTKEGEKRPLGYFYKNGTIYTVVEQPSGDVKLTEYTILFDNLEKVEASTDSIGYPDLPLYQAVAERTGSADRALLDAVYERVD